MSRPIHIKSIGKAPKPGENSQTIQQQLIKAGLAKPDTPGIMRLLDIFVLPSLAEEISNRVLDILATDLPVITTDMGGNEELVEAMVGDIAFPERMSTQESNARLAAQSHFSLTKMVDRYHAVYSRNNLHNN